MSRVMMIEVIAPGDFFRWVSPPATPKRCAAQEETADLSASSNAPQSLTIEEGLVASQEGTQILLEAQRAVKRW
jgi:hypothetical protein